MSEIIVHEKPSLRRPVLIAAFAGWNDAGHAATFAVRHLASSWSAATFAEIDPDEFFDFTTTRPLVKLGKDGQREITWPGCEFLSYRDPKGELDAVLLLGTEPAVRWRAFAQDVTDLARSLGVSMAVTLGAYLAPVSHREAVPISGWAWPEALDERLKSLDVAAVEYEGPTGLVTTLSAAFADARIPVASLWAALPAFLGPTPNPKGALALLRRLDRAFGFGLDLSELTRTSEQFERNVSEAVRRVHGLSGLGVVQAKAEASQPEPESSEPPIGSLPPGNPPELPTAEEVLREVEDFLSKRKET